MRLFSILTLLSTVLHANSLQIDGLAIRYAKGSLNILNQQKLPHEQEWIEVQNPDQMVEIITSLKVRGAPMIGIAAICHFHN